MTLKVSFVNGPEKLPTTCVFIYCCVVFLPCTTVGSLQASAEGEKVGKSKLFPKVAEIHKSGLFVTNQIVSALKLPISRLFGPKWQENTATT